MSFTRPAHNNGWLSGWFPSAVGENTVKRAASGLEQEEEHLTDLLQRILRNAAFREAPEEFHNYVEDLAAFLENPSKELLDELKVKAELVSPRLNPRFYPGICKEDEFLLNDLKDQLESIREDSSGIPELSSEMQKNLEQALRLLDKAIESYRGPIAEAERRVYSLVNRAEHAPRNALGNIAPGLLPALPADRNPPPTPHRRNPPADPLSAAPRAPAPPPPPGAPAAAAEPEDPTFLGQCWGFFRNLLAQASDPAALQAAATFATMNEMTLGWIKNHLEHTQGDDAQRAAAEQTIDGLINQLREAQDTGTWDALTGAIGHCLEVIRANQVYARGWRIPINHVHPHDSAIPDLLVALQEFDNVLGIEGNSGDDVSEAQIEEVSIKLGKRASAYGAIRFVYESILKEPYDHNLYASFIEITPNTPATYWDAQFRKNLFEHIDASSSSRFTKYIAKISYRILFPLFSLFTQTIISNLLGDLQNWKNTPDDPQNPKDMQIIRLARKWLATLSASYNEAAQTPFEEASDLQEMLEKAIQNPRRNAGLTSRELYQASAITIIDRFGPKIRLREAITKHYQTEIPSTSRWALFNPFLQALNLFCSFTVNAVLILPEWIINTFLRLGLRSFVKSNPLIENQLNYSTNSLKSRTQTAHALNQTVYRQLQRVLKLVQEEMPQGGDGLDRASCSNAKAQEISDLVKYLYEVVNKSRCGTQDRLIAYLEGRVSARERVEKEIDEMFLPEILENAVDTISLAIQAVMEEDSLNHLLFDSLSAVNDSMNEQQEVREEEFAGVEQGIRNISDQILETAIYYALNEKFDCSKRKQAQVSDDFVDALKEDSAEFVAILKDEETPLPEPTEEKLSKEPLRAWEERLRTSLIPGAQEFVTTRLKASEAADGNRNLDTEAKQKLNEITHDLGEESKDLRSNLSDSLKLSQERILLEEGDRICEEILAAADQIRLGQITNLAVIRESTRQIGLQIEISKNPKYADLIELENELFGTLQNAVTELETTHQRLGTTVQAALFIQELRRLKIDSIGAENIPREIQRNGRWTENAIAPLPLSEEKREFIRSVRALIDDAHSAEEINRSFHACQANLDGLIISLGQREQERAVLNAVQAIRNPINQAKIAIANRYETNFEALKTAVEGISTAADDFSEWVEAVQKPQIWNVFFLNMTWLTDNTKNLAFARAKQRKQELIDTLYQKHNYLGFMNQGIILPFLEKYGPHHLKQKPRVSI